MKFLSRCAARRLPGSNADEFRRSRAVIAADLLKATLHL